MSELDEIAKAIQDGKSVNVGQGGKVKPPKGPPEGEPPHGPPDGKPPHGGNPPGHDKPVKPPRSFGGAAPPKLYDQTPWNIRRQDIYRRDMMAMRNRYPQFSPLVTGKTVEGWVGDLKPLDSCDDKFRLKLLCHHNYPPTIPAMFIVKPDIFRRYARKGHRHFYDNGAICTFFPPDKSWEAEENDISELIDFACIWLVGHLYWKEYGVWPLPEVNEHDPKRLRKMIRPNAPCFCGSGLTLKECRKNH